MQVEINCNKNNTQVFYKLNENYLTIIDKEYYIKLHDPIVNKSKINIKQEYNDIEVIITSNKLYNNDIDILINDIKNKNINFEIYDFNKACESLHFTESVKNIAKLSNFITNKNYVTKDIDYFVFKLNKDCIEVNPLIFNEYNGKTFCVHLDHILNNIINKKIDDGICIDCESKKMIKVFLRSLLILASINMINIENDILYEFVDNKIKITNKKLEKNEKGDLELIENICKKMDKFYEDLNYINSISLKEEEIK